MKIIKKQVNRLGVTIKAWVLIVALIGTIAPAGAAQQLPRSEVLDQGIHFGDWIETEFLCNQILEKNPDDAVAQVSRARLRSQLGKIDVALDDLGKVLAAHPRFPPALSTRGAILCAIGKAEAGSADLKLYLAVTESARDLDTRNRRAYAFWLLNNRETAKKECQQILNETSSATLPPDVYNRGLAQLNLHKYTDALRTFIKLKQSHSKAPGLLSYIAYCHSKTGNDALALKEFAETAEQVSDYVSNECAWGCELEKLKRYDEALPHLNKAIELEPRFWIALENRAYVYEHLDRLNEACADNRRVVALVPKDPTAWCTLSYALAHLHKWKEAYDACNKALKLSPKYTEALSNRAWAESEMGDHKKAHEDYALAISIDPKRASTYFSRGLLLRDERDYAKSIADFSSAIKLDPTDPQYFCARGCAEVRACNYKQAIADCNKSIQLNPKRTHPYLSRGEAYAALGDYDLALHDLTVVLDQCPSCVEALTKRAWVYQKLKKPELAARDLAKSGK